MCGFLGLLTDDKKAIRRAYKGLRQLYNRGKDSFGFYVYDTVNDDYEMIKGLGSITQVQGRKAEEIRDVEGDLIIGHVRYPTVGRTTDSQRLKDAQPFYASTPGFAMAHNGNITNLNELKEYLIKKRRYPKSDCDVEIINLLLAEEVSQITNSGEITKEDLFNATKQVMEKLQGSYSVVAHIRNVGFLGFRDPYAIRPFVVGIDKKGNWGFASETVALEKIGYDVVRDLNGGEAIFIPQGEKNLESQILVNNKPSFHCMFERVYFARISSVIDGDSIYQARLNMGNELALEVIRNRPGLIEELDLIAPVPNAPRPIAKIMSERFGVVYREILDEDRAGRVFMGHDEKTRDFDADSKFSVIKKQVKGKRIGLVDDSIVRLTNLPRVVNDLKKAKAESIHVFIGCPPITNPCHLGVDIPTFEELAAHKYTIEEIRDVVGVDSLTYLSLQGLKRALRDKSSIEELLKEKYKIGSDDGKSYCYGCVGGDCPITISEKFLEQRRKERVESK